MQRSIYAGDTMVGEGRVVRRYTDEAGARVRHLVDLELTVKNQDGQVVQEGTNELMISRRPEGGSSHD